MRNKVIQLRCDFNDVFIVVECQAHGQSYDAGFNTHLSQLVNFTNQNNCFCTSLIFFYSSGRGAGHLEEGSKY